MKNRKHTQNILAFIGILTLISLIYHIDTAQAAVFNVYTTVCTTDWYCTAWDHGDCGYRTCIDANGCGTNINKPSEYLECEEEPSAGGGGGSGGNSIIIGALPEGYFTLNTDMIKVTIEQGIVVQKIISINSSMPAEYHLEIEHPSSYTKGTEFVGTTSDIKYIEKNGDFNIIIDSREIIIGTYVIPLRLYNEKYSKEILLTIDVIPINNPEIEISLDSKIKNLGVDTEILTFTKTKGLPIDENTTLTYTMLDPKGNILLTEEINVTDASRVEHAVSIPKNIGEGYYTLSIKISQTSGTYIKSEQFAILMPNKYTPVIESPKKNLMLWLWIIIVLASVITLFNTGLFYKSYIPIRNRIGRNTDGWRTRIRPKISLREKLSSLISKVKEQKLLDVESRMKLLKDSYDKGLISSKEYNIIAKRYGYDIKEDSLEETKMTDKEAVESALKKYHEETRLREEKSKEMKKESSKDMKEIVKDEKSIPIGLSNAVNIPIDNTIEEKNTEKETKSKTSESVRREESEAFIEEKKHILETPEVERPIAISTIGGAISHMFAQSIIDKRARPEQAFVLNNHEKLYSIRDLVDAIPNMPVHFFEHHTQHGRNDFSNWIGDIFQYYDIAEEIRNVKSREELITILNKYA